MFKRERNLEHSREKTMSTREINCIETLLDVIQSVASDYPERQLFFRGQKKLFPTVTPSIGRDNYLRDEDKLFREYVLRNPDEFVGERTTFEKLVKMQHYRLPTRLLDISTNPLVALFFAVEQDSQFDAEDGDFIVFAVPEGKVKYYDSDTVSAVANVARRPVDRLDIGSMKWEGGESKMTWIERFNKHEDVQYLLHEIKDEKPYFKDIIDKEHLESIWCVRPLLKNRRIVKQDGAFLLFGINGTKRELANYKDFMPLHFSVKEKKPLRDTLELLGVSKDKLYPELDTTADYLKTRYGK